VDAAVVIRPLRESDLDAIVELSLRAWEPVFESLRAVLGDAIFARLHQPDWRTVQAEAVRWSCTSEERDVFVAVAGEKPVGFATVALNAYHDGMGAVDMIAVDPSFQRRGIATALMNRSADHMREHGMDIAVVETGGDPGHAPARAMYERSGYTALPVVRYLELLRR
jgi:GNAT superfamily N-acetyltransferase